MRRTALRRVRSVLIVLLVLLAIGLAGLWLALRGSLPTLEGDRGLPGLSAAVTVDRDDDGLVGVMAANRDDLARALGFVHAQERYFEMDLSRRSAAGELAALFGAAALPLDRGHRRHRFRTRVGRWWPNLPAEDRATLTGYAQGVNAGLADLEVRPWPYLLLRQRPAAWEPQDSLLVVLSMFFSLQDQDNRRERQLDVAQRHLPPAVFAFVARHGSTWDAPLTGDALPDPVLPTADELDLRTLPAVPAGDQDLASRPSPELPGSNNFAVAGHLTGHGRALVANDMHLGLRAPNIWFRARLRYGAGSDAVDVEGLTLPGVPGVVVGSNGRIAWSFTNSYGDWLDLVRIEVDPARPDHYRSAAGWHRFETFDERLEVAGAQAQTLSVRETRWGPVIGEDDAGRPLALAWTAHREGAVDLGLGGLERAADVDAALAVATAAGLPAQNLIVGDAGGRIAWTIAGRIPRRHPGHDGLLPVDGSSLAGDVWDGWLPPTEHPRVVDPPSGRLWTANARVASGADLALIGLGAYDNGARAGQIRDGLAARERFEESDLLAIQLDDRALFLERWWRLLREVLDDAGEAVGDDARLDELAAATEVWDGCACTDSAAYRLVRGFRAYVHETVMRGLAAPLLVDDADFTWPRLGQNEGVVWQLLERRPAHLLPPPHATWADLLRAQALRVVDALKDQPGGLAARTWGEANAVRVRHPIAGSLPAFAAGWLDMPVQDLPGDSHMPRVQGVRFGASQRSVIAPGLESQALMHMPAGQSGHPLSPYYGAGHRDWADGAASPLRPGSDRWRLKLTPTTGGEAD
jgi:penicillin amidase